MCLQLKKYFFCDRDKLGKGAWSLEQEQELTGLYMENQANPQTDQGIFIFPSCHGLLFK